MQDNESASPIKPPFVEGRMVKWMSLLIIPIVGIVVALFPLFRTEKALALNVLSVSPLQTDDATKLVGLKVILDNVELKKPFLSTVQLTGDGAKAISPSDFEHALKILPGSGIQVMRAEVTEAHPESLHPVVKVADGAISIEPLLINPKDSITLSVLTQGGSPDFKPISRIADVSQVAVIQTTPKGSAFGGYLSAALGIALLWAHTRLLLLSVEAPTKRKEKVLLLASVFVMAGSVNLLNPLAVGINLWNWKGLLILLVVYYCSVTVELAIKRHFARIDRDRKLIERIKAKLNADGNDA